MWIASVAVEKTAYHFDRAFSYTVPPRLAQAARPGCRVLLPFGRANAPRQGLLLDVQEQPAPADEPLKDLQAVLDEAPLLSREALFLISWLKEHYFCTLFDAAKLLLPVGLRYRMRRFYAPAADVNPALEAALPDEQRAVLGLLRAKGTMEAAALCRAAGLPADSPVPEQLCRAGLLRPQEAPVRRMQDASLRMVRLRAQALQQGLKLTPRQKEVVSVLQDAGCASVKELCYFTGVTPTVVLNLAKRGLCELYEQELYRDPRGGKSATHDAGEEGGAAAPIALSPAQEKAYTRLRELYSKPRAAASLLYGVTGSGKTSVYLRLIDQAVQDGRGVLLLLPEISLTPQSESLFRARYGARVAVFHSGLPLGARMDEWKRVQRGQASVVLGTRSAVFAPLRNIGLLIVDEEQEGSYKSEQSPRYQAKEVAWFRCCYHKALLLLVSATPSLESYYAAKQGRMGLDVLPSRFGAARLPQVEICDMGREAEEGNRTVLSRSLLAALQENLAAGRQSILLLNRRGYNTFVTCRDCGEVLTCPHCSISLTYHAASGRLLCHYCGYSMPYTSRCPKCHGTHLHYAGAGTQRAQEQLQALLPGARILRLDADATMRRFAFEKELAAFAAGDYDLIVGTQMVAKGLDFENVTLVGVLNADQSLYADDFRSSERCFSLLTQVVGRAGRGRFTGRAFLQTYTPENPIFSLAASQDYPAFCAQALPLRRAMLYPPFADICVVAFVGAQEQPVQRGGAWFQARLQQLAAAEYARLPLRVLPLSQARVARVSGKYRYRLILKCRAGKSLRQMLSRLLCDFGRERAFRQVSAFADVNPDAIF